MSFISFLYIYLFMWRPINLVKFYQNEKPYVGDYAPGSFPAVHFTETFQRYISEYDYEYEVSDYSFTITL